MSPEIPGVIAFVLFLAFGLLVGTPVGGIVGGLLLGYFVYEVFEQRERLGK